MIGDINKMFKEFQAEQEKRKNNPICHLVMTPFTGLGKPGYRGDEWFKERIKIFKENTLKSLQNQTNQFFVHWIAFRPEEQTNPLTQELFKDLCTQEWRTIFTFGGIPFWDDKFNKTEAKGLLKRLTDTLESPNGIKEIVGDAPYVYETILASDDMYHKDVVESIQQQPFGYRRAVVHQNGYIHDLKTGQLAEWNPPQGHLPPFYTIMYPADVFLDPKKHFDYLKGYKSHEDVETLFDCVRLPDQRYMVNVHGANISTSWEGYRHNELNKTKHDFIQNEVLDEKEKEEILKNFGICQKSPVLSQPPEDQPSTEPLKA
jgi:hypothetical protein